ncbi:YceI family protein [Demetria terragena]|uniref:YceI family protein n=1 Tax=Demetria terragena TaxID=63959 RepID=UPI00035E2750|nr:YceI family protein [Demetria terragena]
MTATLQSLTGTYVIDPSHSQVGFVARHAMVTKVRGAFDEFEGKAVVDGDISTLQTELTIQTASINTRNADRDGHLRTGDFLEAEAYPTITFRSTGASVEGDTLNVTGDLTIKDVTKQITVPFEFGGAAQDPFGNERVGFEGSTVIVRSDFGINFNAALETGGVLVSDKITLEFEISAIKQA